MTFLLEKTWKFEERFGIISPESPKGVLFNVVGVPTWNETHKVPAFGGVGETGVTYAIERLIGQSMHDDAGGNSREIIGKRSGFEGQVSDAILNQYMDKLVKDGDSSVDYEVDNRALNFALDLLSQRGIAGVGTKILNLLIHHCEERLDKIQEFLDQYALVTIAVTAQDSIATQRKMFSALLKGREYKFEDAQMSRILRLPKDVAKFSMAYPWLQYSRELVLESSTTVLFDNSINRTNREMDMYVASMLWDIARTYPKLEPFIEKNLK